MQKPTLCGGEKFGLLNVWYTNRDPSSQGISIWRNIDSLWPVFSQHIDFKTGNGRKISFWQDKWLGHLPLRELFPVIYRLVLDKEFTVAQCWEDNSWNIKLRRDINDWELNEVPEFFSILPISVSLTSNEDRLIWRGHRNTEIERG